MSKKRGPYIKLVKTEPKVSVCAKPTVRQFIRWKKLAVRLKRYHTAMALDAMEEFMEKYDSKT